MSHIDALAAGARVSLKRCPRCGKRVYGSESEARTALQTLAVLRLIEYNEVSEHTVYRCHEKFNRDVWHLTSHRNGKANHSVEAKRAVKVWNGER